MSSHSEARGIEHFEAVLAGHQVLPQTEDLERHEAWRRLALGQARANDAAHQLLAGHIGTLQAGVSAPVRPDGRGQVERATRQQRAGSATPPPVSATAGGVSMEIHAVCTPV